MILRNKFIKSIFKKSYNHLLHFSGNAFLALQPVEKLIYK